MSDALTPAGLDLKDSESTFVVLWEDGTESRVPYRALRLACHCALCVEELTGEQLLDPATVPQDIGIKSCREVGLYGVQIEWTDSHSTGIYTWEHLRGLGA